MSRIFQITALCLLYDNMSVRDVLYDKVPTDGDGGQHKQKSLLCNFDNFFKQDKIFSKPVN